MGSSKRHWSLSAHYDEPRQFGALAPCWRHSEASCADPQSNQWNSKSRKPTVDRGISGLTERRRVVSTLAVRAVSKEACHQYWRRSLRRAKPRLSSTRWRSTKGFRQRHPKLQCILLALAHQEFGWWRCPDLEWIPLGQRNWPTSPQ